MKRLESLNLIQKDIKQIQNNIPKLNKEINILKEYEEKTIPVVKKKQRRPP